MTLDPTIEARVRALRDHPLEQDADALALYDEVERLRDALADEHAGRCADQLDLAGARALLAEQTARAERAEAAIQKINTIRNSIVQRQQINWSQHIYPLVAALNEAGVVGDGYDLTREKAKAEIEQLKRDITTEVVAERDAALAANAEMRAALECAISEHEARVGECCCAICDTAKAALARPDLGAGVVVVPREVVERWAADVDQRYVITAEMRALLKKGGG